MSLRLDTDQTNASATITVRDPGGAYVSSQQLPYLAVNAQFTVDPGSYCIEVQVPEGTQYAISYTR